MNFNEKYTDAEKLMEKWSPTMGNIQEAFDGDVDRTKLAITSMLLENAQGAIDYHNRRMVNEGITQTSDVSYYKKYALELLTVVVPNMIAPDKYTMSVTTVM